MPGYDGVKSYFSSVLRYDDDKMDLAQLEKGSKVVAGTILGRVGKTNELAPHLHFEIRPTGRGAPKIDPKPILDGWKLLEATAIYRAAGKNPFAGTGVTTGQVLLMSKEQLIKRVLVNNRLELSACDLDYVRGGQIDRRILAAMEYLTARGYRLTITSMLCGRETSITTSGNVSNHSYGGAIDIAQINGIPVLGNQGPGTVAEALVRDTLELQGTMEPDEVISLMSFGGPSFAMSDHHDHVHIGYRPTSGPASSLDKQFVQLLEPEQWERLIDQIGSIDNPTVPTDPSKYSLPAKKGKKQHGIAPRPPTSASSRTLSLFGFVQFELPGSLGIADGRYPVREAADGHRRTPRRRWSSSPRPTARPIPLAGGCARRSRRAADADARPTCRSHGSWSSWRPRSKATPRPGSSGSRKDEAERDELVERGLACIRRAVAARRITATDPAIADPTAESALAIRIGFGEGDELVERQWEQAIEVPRDTQRASRSEALRPQERMAALLGLRDTPLACEELVLRARADDAGAAAAARLRFSCAWRSRRSLRSAKGSPATARRRTSRRSTSGERPRATRPTRRSTARCRPSAPPRSKKRSRSASASCGAARRTAGKRASARARPGRRSGRPPRRRRA